MAASTYILFVDDDAWRITVVKGQTVVTHDVTDGDSSPASADRAAQAVQLLRREGHRGEQVILAIPSAWCLAASIDTQGLPRRQRRQAMTYRLEEKLPLAIEELAIDFIAGRDHALGVAVKTTLLRPVIDALESAGVPIHLVAPAALLARQSACADASAASTLSACDVTLWAQGNHIDLIQRHAGAVQAWRLLSADGPALIQHLRLIALHSGSPVHVIAHNLSPATVDELRGCAECELVHTGLEPMEQSVAALAPGLVWGGVQPWINLRRDALAADDPGRLVRRPLTAALLAAAFLLAASIFAMHWRAQQYGEQAAAGDAEQQAVYRQVFPSGPLPQSPRVRLASELRALRGRSGDAAEMPEQTSALAQLHDALVRLPSGLRFRVLDIRIDGQRLTLDGQARGHGDADAIAAALRQRNGFNVEPPRTEQLRDEKGVAFTITATRAPSSSGPLGSAPNLEEICHRDTENTE